MSRISVKDKLLLILVYRDHVEQLRAEIAELQNEVLKLEQVASKCIRFHIET